MKYLILGAGPAGLTVAAKLKQQGKNSFLVLEKENIAGGLCRSAIVDNAPLDTGGGHFLDTKRHNVNKFLFQFMPETEWNVYIRDSQLQLNDIYIHHPIEANIWELPENIQREYLESIFYAGCNQNVPVPDTFIEWIHWKFGDKITDDYMLPYNQKIFCNELNELGTYWLEKLPNVSYEETIKSCRHRKAYGTQPGHAKFYYPKRTGYGELWNRMANTLREHILFNINVKQLDFINMNVTSSEGNTYEADVIINTIPWKEFDMLVGMPERLVAKISNLKHSSIEIRYFQENLDTKAQWIYYPDKKLPYHRILVRSNFCTGSRGYWTETRKERAYMFNAEESSAQRFENEYAYPLNTIGKQEIIKELLEWCAKRHVYGLGRWGEHQHYNSDRVVELGMQLAERIGHM